MRKPASEVDEDTAKQTQCNREENCSQGEQ